MRVGPTLDELRGIYKDDLRIVYRYYVVHEPAIAPGLAACAANKQGKFREMEHLIWTKGFEVQDLSVENMARLATLAGLDEARFAADVGGKDCAAWLEAGRELAAVGTNGTPAFYINGRYLSGAQPVPEFKKIIDEELAKANKAIAGGIAPEDYYATIVKSGKKSLEEDE